MCSHHGQMFTARVLPIPAGMLILMSKGSQVATYVHQLARHNYLLLHFGHLTVHCP